MKRLCNLQILIGGFFTTLFLKNHYRNNTPPFTAATILFYNLSVLHNEITVVYAVMRNTGHVHISLGEYCHENHMQSLRRGELR